MKQNNPLHKEIQPHKTEETLWNAKENSPFLSFWLAIVIKWTTLSRVRWGSISGKHSSNLHITASDVLKPQHLWRYRVQRPWFCRKTAAWRSHFLPCRCPNKTEETGLCRFPTALQRHLKYRNQSAGLFFFLISLILLKVSHVSFSVLHWKFLAYSTLQTVDCSKATYVHVHVVVPRQNYHHQLHLVKLVSIAVS